MIELFAICLFTFGTLVIAISSLGLIRMKTPLLLLQAAGIAVSMGMFFVFIGAALYFNDAKAWWICGGSYFFILISSPVGTHVLALAVYKTPVYPRKK